MLVSIITPSFRNAKWLRLCIASVSDQDGAPHEQIVQDAGSDDGTLEWLRTDQRVRAFVEADDGMYDAINRGLRRAGGDILGYLNCDEQYLEGTLDKVAKFFERNPTVEVLFGDAILVDQKGAPLSYRRTVLPGLGHVRLVHLNTLTCATFFRRSILERGCYFETQWKTIGDAAWVARLLELNVSMAVLNEPFATFTFTGENLGASPRAMEELRTFRAGEWKRLFVPFLSLQHRIRKWRAGAYRPHQVDYAIYTQDSPERRKRFTANSLGFGWPREVQET